MRRLREEAMKCAEHSARATEREEAPDGGPGPLGSSTKEGRPAVWGRGPGGSSAFWPLTRAGCGGIVQDGW